MNRRQVRITQSLLEVASLLATGHEGLGLTKRGLTEDQPPRRLSWRNFIPEAELEPKI